MYDNTLTNNDHMELKEGERKREKKKSYLRSRFLPVKSICIESDVARITSPNMAN